MSRDETSDACGDEENARGDAGEPNRECTFRYKRVEQNGEIVKDQARREGDYEAERVDDVPAIKHLGGLRHCPSSKTIGFPRTTLLHPARLHRRSANFRKVP